MNASIPKNVLYLALGVVCLVHSGLRASESFRDDFTNPNPEDPGRSPVTWFTGANDDPLSISGGQLIVQDSAYTAIAGVEGLTPHNVAVEAQFQVLDGTQGGLYLRTNRAASEGYHSHIRNSTHPDSPDTTDIWRDIGPDLTKLSKTIHVDFDTSGLVKMRLEAIGDNLSLWVWPAGTAQPQQPIATAQDAIWSDGFVGLHVSDVDGQPPELSRMAVDYFKVEILEIPGDYNQNGAVDAADYTVWRDHLGQTLALPNEDLSTTPGQVTAEDYDFWKSHFGQTASMSAAAGSPTAVPEPAMDIILLVGMATMLASRRVLV